MTGENGFIIVSVIFMLIKDQEHTSQLENLQENTIGKNIPFASLQEIQQCTHKNKYHIKKKKCFLEQNLVYISPKKND